MQKIQSFEEYFSKPNMISESDEDGEYEVLNLSVQQAAIYLLIQGWSEDPELYKGSTELMAQNYSHDDDEFDWDGIMAVDDLSGLLEDETELEDAGIEDFEYYDYKSNDKIMKKVTKAVMGYIKDWAPFQLWIEPYNREATYKIISQFMTQAK